MILFDYNAFSISHKNGEGEPEGIGPATVTRGAGARLAATGTQQAAGTFETNCHQPWATTIINHD